MILIKTRPRQRLKTGRQPLQCPPLQPWLYPWVHDDVIKWKHFPHYLPFVRGIHRLPVNSPHKGQWRGTLMFSLICARINCWVNNREAGDLRRHRTHYDVIVMFHWFIMVMWRHGNAFIIIAFAKGVHRWQVDSPHLRVTKAEISLRLFHPFLHTKTL